MAGAEAIQRPERKKMHMYKSEDGCQKLVPPPIRSQQNQRCRQPVKILWRTLGSRVSPTVEEKLPKRLSEGKLGLGRVPEPQMTLHLHLLLHLGLRPVN